MPNGTVSICKFVGTISLGLLTGVSASLSTIALPSLLTLPTAVTARTTLTYLSSKTRVLSSYLRHITTFTLFSAYLLSPRRFRHPYLLYTSIFAFVSGPGVDYAISYREGTNERRTTLDLEAQGDDVNGEQVRQAVEKMRFTESVRAVVAGVAFAIEVVGIWGDGA
ncbi:hypothetical protein BU26DRAFT_458578 [Trematosphaeria pertusa]|uniref:DUF1772-domain-containing protein n=1 Tax=Trematosphaeria pertusa TaxID=390896 RepID=A0A6A6IDQ6_9PLEO|nr:uncharacterized protein BU26DRAFT_458578 [Trematosphaeria pertusa]KAF2248337.1 hypothetical protein BU26DRAFT_458578 [Trematosphaeria pertusa]